MSAPLALPFSTTEFFAVFARYNDAVWPAQTVLLTLALTCILAVSARAAGRTVGFILAVLWAWMAIAYHWAFFTSINPAAWGFGGLFLLGAAAFAWHALRGTLTFGRPAGVRGAVGALLVLYALVGYPVVETLLGIRYPAAPTFGLPCPTTLFTIGMLMFAERPAPRGVFAIPIAWALVGSYAAFGLGVAADLGLLVAAAAGVAALVHAQDGRAAPRSGPLVSGVDRSR